MDADEVFLSADHNKLKTNLPKLSDENNENYMKCKVEEISELLSLKKLALEQPRYEKSVSLSEAEWDDDLKLAKVTKIVKNLTKNFSHSRNKLIYLYPEECLCLMEMKCLVLTWKEKKLSIKNAFALLLNFSSGCTFEQFRTYGYLVKLGFRVFRHNENIKNTCSFDPKDLIKLPVKSKKKKFISNKPIKNDQGCKNKVTFSKLSSNQVVISRPPQWCMPYNVQPDYDTYSFKLAVKSDGHIEITEMVSFYETKNLKKISFHPQTPIIYDLQPSGMYPIYEKSIPKIKNLENDNQDKHLYYVPPIKKSKLVDNESKSLPIITNITICTSNNKSNLHALNSKTDLTNKVLNNFNNKEHTEAEKDSSPAPLNVVVSTSNDEYNLHLLNNEIEKPNRLLYTNNEENKQICEEVMEYSKQNLNLSMTEEYYNKLKICTSNNIPEDDVFGTQLNISSHIKEKLFAVKSKLIDKTSNDHNTNHKVHYDVYYPNNNVAKTTRPPPDFRVIVFSDEDMKTFPNIYKITISTPNDNVPMLWAIVNSSQVSFYNVDCIVLPKSTEWKMKGKKDLY